MRVAALWLIKERGYEAISAGDIATGTAPPSGGNAPASPVFRGNWTPNPRCGVAAKVSAVHPLRQIQRPHSGAHTVNRLMAISGTSHKRRSIVGALVGGYGCVLVLHARH